MLNQKIHNYRITRKIGSGGMAIVYEAIHTKLDTKVAIKVLDPVLAANENIRQRFMQEAKIMASLNHEGITKVLDFDEEDNHLAIIMEYLDGKTLDELVKQKGTLSEARAKEIFIPVLEAFAYAHKKGIVHRDVKPSNIFITTEGKVKIMDFGIAKIVEDGANVLTQTGTQMGTPVYMSPEQVNDSKHIDHRTDIYSLGVTLWFMLEGKAPYNTSTDSSFEIFTKIVNAPLGDIPQFNSIVQKATSKNIQNRYKDCNEFKIDLVSDRPIIETQKQNLNPPFENTIIELPDEEDLWINVKRENTINAYKGYLELYKDGKYRKEASIKIGKLISENKNDRSGIMTDNDTIDFDKLSAGEAWNKIKHTNELGIVKRFIEFNKNKAEYTNYKKLVKNAYVYLKIKHKSNHLKSYIYTSIALLLHFIIYRVLSSEGLWVNGSKLLGLFEEFSFQFHMEPNYMYGILQLAFLVGLCMYIIISVFQDPKGRVVYISMAWIVMFTNELILGLLHIVYWAEIASGAIYTFSIMSLLFLIPFVLITLYSSKTQLFQVPFIKTKMHI
jgi:serine/threonine protein kinase